MNGQHIPEHRYAGFKKILWASMISLTAMCGTPVLAANFDFAQIADTFPAAGTGESAWKPFVWTDSGVTLTATARNLANTLDYWVYMDSGDAGMGVCKSLIGGAPSNVARSSTGNICSQASDDNLTMDEVLVWEFSEVVELDLSIVDGNHGTTFEGNFGVFVGAGDPTTVGEFTQLALSATVSDPILTGSRFTFISGATITGTESITRQMYLSGVTTTAAVPEPGTMVLLGTGLIGLVGWRFRK